MLLVHAIDSMFTALPWRALSMPSPIGPIPSPATVSYQSDIDPFSPHRIRAVTLTRVALNTEGRAEYYPPIRWLLMVELDREEPFGRVTETWFLGHAVPVIEAGTIP